MKKYLANTLLEQEKQRTIGFQYVWRIQDLQGFWRSIYPTYISGSRWTTTMTMKQLDSSSVNFPGRLSDLICFGKYITAIHVWNTNTKYNRWDKVMEQLDFTNVISTFDKYPTRLIVIIFWKQPYISLTKKAQICDKEQLDFQICLWWYNLERRRLGLCI